MRHIVSLVVPLSGMSLTSGRVLQCFSQRAILRPWVACSNIPIEMTGMFYPPYSPVQLLAQWWKRACWIGFGIDLLSMRCLDCPLV